MSIISNAQKQFRLRKDQKNLRIKTKCQSGDYFEIHHILPKSLFPKWAKRESNLVLLTAREHFFCHQLLSKIYPGKEMFCALWILANDGQNNYCVKGSREYENLKKKCSQFHKGGPKKGHIVSQETREKIRNTLRGKMAGKNNPMYGKSSLAKKTPEEKAIINEKKRQAMLGRSPSTKGQIAMVKDNTQISINPEDIELYISQGFKKGGVSRAHKKVLCVETQEVFDGCKAVLERFGFKSTPSLINACNGKRKQAFGYHWEWAQ